MRHYVRPLHLSYLILFVVDVKRVAFVLTCTIVLGHDTVGVSPGLPASCESYKNNFTFHLCVPGLKAIYRRASYRYTYSRYLEDDGHVVATFLGSMFPGWVVRIARMMAVGCATNNGFCPKIATEIVHNKMSSGLDSVRQFQLANLEDLSFALRNNK